MAYLRDCDICGGKHGCLRYPGDCVPLPRCTCGDMCDSYDFVECPVHSECPVGYPKPHDCIESGCFEAAADVRGDQDVWEYVGIEGEDTRVMRPKPVQPFTFDQRPEWVPDEWACDLLNDDAIDPYYYSCGANYCDDPACIMNRPNHPEYYGPHPEVL